MGFFEILFRNNNSDEKNNVLNTPDNQINVVSPIEEIVVMCINDLKQRGKFSTLNLEAEAINLATYIYLRDDISIHSSLNFLPNGIIEKTRSNDYSESDKVFTFFVKHSSGLYNTQHAEIGKKNYRININLDKTIDQTLQYHFHKIHNEMIPKKDSHMQNLNITAEAVDLGLDSGTLWASKNIGASEEYENGTYFAWGETSGKDIYGWESFKHANGSFSTITKYCDNASYGRVDNKFFFDDEDDAAKVILGDKWHTPSSIELKELIDCCNWRWECRNGKYGWTITGPNGNRIFVPASGAYSSYRLSRENEIGRYWCSDMQSTHSSYGLRFNNDEFKIVDDTKFYGRPIRPVFGDKVLRSIKSNVSENKENKETKTLYPHNTVSVPKLIARNNDQVSDVEEIVNAILIILNVDTKTILSLTEKDRNEIYKAYCCINAICISELCKKDNVSFIQQCNKLAGVYAYKNISKEDEVPEKCKFAYAIGAEAMWRTFDWWYTVGYTRRNSENEKNEFKEKTILEVKEYAENAIVNIDFSEDEKKYFMKGAMSLVEDKIVGTTAYGMLAKSFPNIF